MRQRRKERWLEGGAEPARPGTETKREPVSIQGVHSPAVFMGSLRARGLSPPSGLSGQLNPLPDAFPSGNQRNHQGWTER